MNQAHCRQLLREAVQALRLGVDGVGNARLIELVDHCLLPTVKKDLPDPGVVHGISQLLEAQARGDYLRVADVLQFELGPRFLALWTRRHQDA